MCYIPSLEGKIIEKDSVDLTFYDLLKKLCLTMSVFLFFVRPSTLFDKMLRQLKPFGFCGQWQEKAVQGNVS